MNHIESMFSLAGKTALVTGAGAGIGQAIAIGLAKAGAHVLLVGRNNNLEHTAQMIRESGGDCTPFVQDLSLTDAILPFSEQVLKDYEVDILVNNAGIQRRQPAIDFSMENWDDVIRVNLTAVFAIAQAFARPMLERRRGKIINIASLSSFQGGIYVPAYTAAKSGVSGLTKAFANEWATLGVQVNAIAPGYIHTNMTDPLVHDEQRNPAILARIPAGVWGKPEDLAGAAMFLASPASDYVNGHTLVVDGGWLAR